MTFRLLDDEEPVSPVVAAAAAGIFADDPSPTNGVLVDASTTHNGAANGSRTPWPETGFDTASLMH